MGHAASYTLNIARSYAARNETVAVEVVANGSGIKLFRDDETPLRLPLAALRQQVLGVTYSMCDASRRIAE